MDGHHTLLIYECIARVTQQMLAAARQSDWDTLVKLERECSSHFARLLTHQDDVVLDALHRRRKAELIRKVLDDDAEIRLLTEPWLAQLTSLLDHAGRQRQLQRAYQNGH